ncbi:hypothetical protein BOTBODRAFT_118627 [Botryobasidium botryosum FD-172 SS1]|uniref:Tubulin-tyrosine ligase n=1 Tax=Botryobasidium botryosum (strain FD-172 SS1) TaxID=930990 RepID=A0A067MA42_BOTB1|nr:hypothetical protein BOTBODRAFT_118627 [Botryobasidium botryosum FD-172 SS1]
MSEVPFIAFVSFPSAPYTTSLIHSALSTHFPTVSITAKFPDGVGTPVLQWSTYDDISHERTLSDPRTVLASSYTFRKALIRKHFLNNIVQSYITKHPDSCLVRGVPQTWAFEISWADELDDMWVDELWDLAQMLEDSDPMAGPGRWFILKPSMADRGMGIRLFESKDALKRIFESFEDDEDEERAEREDEDSGDQTDVSASQLRHFVVQEYLPRPLLIDPAESSPGGVSSPLPSLQGRKFHIRAYCVAAGALSLYLYPRFLALFAAKPYAPPCRPEDDDDDDEGDNDAPLPLDLAPHLTNTSLQQECGDENVRLLSELIGSHIFSIEGDESEQRLSEEDVRDITDQIAALLADVFQAAINSPIHFQALPNAFELFGTDFLVAHNPPNSSKKFQVHLLELNAEPAIELTGARLGWILQELFTSIARVCVKGFFEPAPPDDGQGSSGGGNRELEGWEVGEERFGLRKCLEVQVRGKTGW